MIPRDSCRPGRSPRRGARPASYITVRSVNTRAAKAAPGLEVTVAAAAIRAHEGTVLTVSAITALSLAPVADPARIAVRTLAGDMVAGMPVAAGWAAVATTFAVETGGAGLVTFGSVPAGLACQTAAFDYRARLLAFALATPTATARAIESSGAWLATILAPVARIAGTPCRPPGGSDRESTGNSDHSGRQTCARDTGSGHSAARRATSCRRTGCYSCGPTSLRGTGRRLSVDRTGK